MPGEAARMMGWAQRMRNTPGPFAAPTSVQRGGQSPVDFAPGRPLRINVYLALGADLTAAPSTWAWTDITNYVRYDPSIAVITGRQDESSTVTPGRATLTIDNRDGRFSRKNPSGAYYGQLSRNTPILITINAGSATYRAAEMFVNEWPSRWDKTQTDFTVPISCGGILRRLAQGATVQLSALRQTITASTSTVAYWPLEDGSQSTTAAEIVTGATTTIVTDFGFGDASATELYGSSSLALPHVTSPGGSSSLVSRITGYIPTFPSTWSANTDRWAVSWVQKVPVQPSSVETLLMELYSTDQVIQHIQVVLGTDGKIRTRSINSNGVDELTDGGTTFNQFTTNGTIYGRWAFFTISYSDDGTKSTISTTWADASQSYSSTNAMNVGPSGAHRINAQPNKMLVSSATNAVDEFGLGHIAVYKSSTVPITASVAFGYAGERADTRISRICGEVGVQIAVQGTSSTLMGAQSGSDPLVVLRECETADGGVLYETGFGLGYQTRSARHNANEDITVDVTLSQVSDELAPVDDDQALRNGWTVSRTNGSSVVASDTSNQRLNGKYTDSLTVNISSDSELNNVAYWLLHIGTQDDIRWTQVPLNFARTEAVSLIDTWISLGFGAKMSLKNLPGQVQSDSATLFIEGKTETFNQFMWTVNMNASPGRIDDVFRIEARASLGPASNVGRFGLVQTLTSSIGTSDTSMQVTTASTAALMTTLAADFPMDIVMDGERMTVTNVTGSSSPQTVTMTRSVNNVSKAHTAGATMDVYRPGVISR